MVKSLHASVDALEATVGTGLASEARRVLSALAAPMALSLLAVYCGVSLIYYFWQLTPQALGLASAVGISAVVVCAQAVSLALWQFVFLRLHGAKLIDEPVVLQSWPIAACLSWPFVAFAIRLCADCLPTLHIHSFQAAMQAGAFVVFFAVLAGFSVQQHAH